MKARLLGVLFLLCLVAQAQSGAKPNNFWKLDSERAGDVTVATFSAKKPALKGQGLLMSAVIPAKAGEEPHKLEPAEVLASLYTDLKDFELLGRKETTWGGQTAELISFKALVNKRHVVGRSLMAQTPTGSEVLLLVTNKDVQKDFSKEFERLQARWEFGRPAASNVLYLD